MNIVIIIIYILKSIKQSINQSINQLLPEDLEEAAPLLDWLIPTGGPIQFIDDNINIQLN